MPTDFETAFANARAQGVAQFSFNGKQYSTRLKEEQTGPLQLSMTDTVRKSAKGDPSLRNIENYNTGLTQPELDEYYSWANKKYGGYDKVLYEMGAYDLQGAWKDIKDGKIDFDPETGHLPDTYKKPNHISFSNESRYHDGKNTIGGQWEETGDRWKFKPAAQTVELYGKPALEQYFQEHEKDVDLEF